MSANEPDLTAETAQHCAHLFARHGKAKVQGYWFRQAWWRCVHCGAETHTYNSIDRMMMRPVHRHMGVALPGFNTVTTTGQAGVDQ